MPNDLLGEIHSSTATTSPDWATFRGEVTGMYLLSGQGGEWGAQHLIREYNRNINSLSTSWTGTTEANATGLFIEPYNAGFSYQGTGDFRDYKWDTYSLQFDGVDDFVETEADDTLATKTYSFWVKATGTDTAPIFHHGARTQGGFFFNYVLGSPFLFLGTSQFRYWVASSAQIDNAWHHWALYLDHTSTSDCELYVDGVLQTVSATIEAGGMDAYSSGIAIGGQVTVGAGDKYFDGSIDEFAIFDGELSAAQIVAIYNGGTPESVASYNPDAWWRMGDGDTFPTLQDSSTNNYTGTMQNMDAADIVADTP